MNQKTLVKHIMGYPEKCIAEKVRIYTLKKGDFFKMFDNIYRVTSLKFNRIYYRSIYNKDTGGKSNSFGDKCQAKVLLITLSE